MTYNGVGLTDLATPADTGTYLVEARYLPAPASGANTFEITLDAAAFDLAAAISTYTDVDQSTPVGTPVASTGSSTTPSVTCSSAAGELVVDGLTIEHSGTLTVGSGQSERYNAIGAGGYMKYSGSDEAGAASVPMAWGNTNSVPWAGVCVPLKPVAVAGASKTLMLLGVGQ